MAESKVNLTELTLSTLARVDACLKKMFYWIVELVYCLQNLDGVTNTREYLEGFIG